MNKFEIGDLCLFKDGLSKVYFIITEVRVMFYVFSSEPRKEHVVYTCMLISYDHKNLPKFFDFGQDSWYSAKCRKLSGNINDNKG